MLVQTKSIVNSRNINNVINYISKRNYSTSVKKIKDTRWEINPLKISGKKKSYVFCSLDVETIKLYGYEQVPILITFAYLIENKVNCLVVKIDHKLLLVNKDNAINKMWSEFYDKLISLNLGNNLIIYSHNLGALLRKMDISFYLLYLNLQRNLKT